MNVKNWASVAGMVALAAGSFVYMSRLGLDISPLDDPHTATMSLPDSNGLVLGSRVLVRGIAVGSVTAIDATAENVQVSWDYDSDYNIPMDSTFRVDSLSALGEAYVAVTPRDAGGPYFADNAVIPDDRIVVPTPFQELSERLTKLLDQVEPDKLREIFETVDVALPEDPWVLGNLNHAGTLLAQALTEQSDNLTDVLNRMQPILQSTGTIPGDLVATTPHLQDFGTGFTDLLAGIYFANDFGPLTSIEDGAAPLIDELQAFLDKSAADLQILGVDLLPGVSAGAAAMSTVDIGQFLDNALAATDSGDALTIHVRTPAR